MPKILIVLTAARVWSQNDGTQRPTGFWAEEFVAPHRAFRDAGADITIATPGGKTPVPDAMSLALEANNGDAALVADVTAYLEEVEDLLEHPAKLEDVDPADYDAVLVPGGHGPMQDLAVNPDVARVLGAMLPDGSKVVAALCHGQSSFLSAGTPDGTWLFKGRKLTSFTDEEETITGLALNAPWLLKKRLRAGGAEFTSGPAWGPFVVVDGNLVTGQNPASGKAVAEAVLEALAARV